MSLKILVASKNPVKIKAAEKAFAKMFPAEEIQSSGISVQSGVPDQPVGIDETLLGAKNRVKGLRKAGERADYYVGMEGGISYVGENCFAFAWMYVENNNGATGSSMTGFFSLPPDVVGLLKEGMELGHANDRIFGSENSKQKGGAVGLLTEDIIDRTEYYVHAMILALIPFIKSSYYKNSDK